MAPSNYDLNLHLTLATTAAHEGDIATALEFLAQAARLARGVDRERVLGARLPLPVFAF